MSQERVKRLGEASQFGRTVSDRVTPSEHFLMRLDEIISWQRFTYKLVKYYRGNAKEGWPPYDPAVLLQMLLLAYLYNLSQNRDSSLSQELVPPGSLFPDFPCLMVCELAYFGIL
jgi:hypothetical protein